MAPEIIVPSPSQLRERFDFRARRGIGQHFLNHNSTLNRIAERAEIVAGSTTVVEVGMGPGYLTAHLLEREPRHVAALEMDDRFTPLHAEFFGGVENLRVHYGDALDCDFATLLPEETDARDVVLAGNIPYQITSPLLFKIWEGPVRFRTVILMVQREVAERMVADPGSKTYGLLRLKAQYFGEVKIEFGVPRTRFRPEPRVDSAIISFKPHPELAYVESERLRFFSLLDGAFAQRRKTIVNSLVNSPPFAVEKPRLLAALEACAIDPGCRAETVSLAQFHRLYAAVIK